MGGLLLWVGCGIGVFEEVVGKRRGSGLICGSGGSVGGDCGRLVVLVRVVETHGGGAGRTQRES